MLAFGPASGMTISLYQTEWAAGAPAWAGSPGSAVADVVSAFVVPPNPVMTMALAKLSFAGAAAVAVEDNPIQAISPSGTRPSRLRNEIFIRNLRITVQSIKPIKKLIPYCLTAVRSQPDLRRARAVHRLLSRGAHAHPIDR